MLEAPPGPPAPSGPSSTVHAVRNIRRSSATTIEGGSSRDKARRRVCEVLGSVPEFQRRGERIAECSSAPWIGRTDEGLPTVIIPRCHDRLCSICQGRRSVRIARDVNTLLEHCHAPRFLTLTVKGDRDGVPIPLPELVKLLLASFRRLRQVRDWRQRVEGGCATLQVTRNPTNGLWHPHLHCIIDGEFFPHGIMKALWLKATGTSHVVNLQAIHDRVQTARYVASYVAKSADLASWPAAAILEYLSALRSTRLFMTFGRFHGVNLCPRERPRPNVRFIMSAALLHRRIEQGCWAAAEAADLVRRFIPALCTPLGLKPEIEASTPPTADVYLKVVDLFMEALSPPPHHPPPP
jgi:hypothetical protein